MPEAPDLQVIKEFLERTLTGVAITEARVLRPIVLRSLAAPDFSADIAGRAFTGFWRKGKLLGCQLSLKGESRGGPGSPLAPSGPADRLLVINPMLSGGLQHCALEERLGRKTFIVLALTSGRELRYFDDDQMGMVYYLRPDQLAGVPRLMEQGPDVLDEPLSLEAFRARLKPFRGEIKGVLTRGGLVSGVGNAYADEVCFEAGLFPFRKIGSLTAQEVERLRLATYLVPQQALEVLRERVGEDIHQKVRDFLKVHRKGGQPCPHCGGRITEISANGRLHNYCRRCQPGSLLGGRSEAPALSQGGPEADGRP